MLALFSLTCVYTCLPAFRTQESNDNDDNVGDDDDDDDDKGGGGGNDADGVEEEKD